MSANETTEKFKAPPKPASEATLVAPSGSAFQPDTGDDALCNVRRLRAEIRMLRAALQPFANLFDGDLKQVGGGTLIAPTIKVQMVKDAKAALSPNDPSSATGAGRKG